MMYDTEVPRGYIHAFLGGGWHVPEIQLAAEINLGKEKKNIYKRVVNSKAYELEIPVTVLKPTNVVFQVKENNNK